MPKQVRIIRPTLLIVGEGDAEYDLLRMLRDQLCSQRRGPSVTIRNAKGKGARSVINDAIRIASRGSYDKVAALFDTDTDWGPAVEKIGMRGRVKMLTQTPCLERILLSANGVHIQGDTTLLKREYERTYGGPAHRTIRQAVTIDLLDARRADDPEVEAIFQVFT